MQPSPSKVSWGMLFLQIGCVFLQLFTICTALYILLTSGPDGIGLQQAVMLASAAAVYIIADRIYKFADIFIKSWLLTPFKRAE